MVISLNNWNDTFTLKSICSSYGHNYIGKYSISNKKFVLVKTSSKDLTFIFSNYLISLGLFEFAEPNLLFKKITTSIPNDPYFSQSWHLKNTGSNNYYGYSGSNGADINVEGAWDLLNGSCGGINIAILDFGVTPHPDLTTFGFGFNALKHDPYFLTPVNSHFRINNGKPEKNFGHGTACAGIAAGKGNNGIGITGVAYKSTVFGIKIFESSGLSSTLVMCAAYYLAVDSAKADVISGSYALFSPKINSYNSFAISQAINYANNFGRNGLGTSIFHSTGNGTSGCLPADPPNKIGFPASNPQVIAVTGTDVCDGLKRSGDCTGWVHPQGECSVASYGPGTDIAAPYHDIWTTDIPGILGYSTGDYTNFSGTSAACPIVGGVMGLIYSANPYLSQSQARMIIESTAAKVGSYSYTNVTNQPNGTWSNELGYGRVDAQQAVNKALITKIDLRISNGPSDFDASEGTITKSDFTMYPMLHLYFKDNGGAYINYNVKWYRDGILISTVTSAPYIDLSKPGKYYATVENNCNNKYLPRTEEIEIRPTCTGISYNNAYSAGYTFFGVTTFPTISNIEPVPVNGDLIIGAGATVNVSNRQFIFGNCSKLIIQFGGTLNATNCQFIGCDNWQGIICDGATSSVNITNSYIANATTGIISKSGGALNINLSTFAYNYLHAAIDGSLLTSNIDLYNNNFTELADMGAGTPPCNNAYYNGLIISTQQPKIYIKSSLAGSVNSNNFQISKTYINSNIKCYVSTSSDNLTFNYNNVKGDYDQVFTANTGNNLTLNGNTFENYYPGILPTNPINQNCMYFKDVKGSSIYDNEVKLYKYGCQFIQNLATAPLTTMEQNKYRICNIGVVYGSILNPIGAGFGSSNLPYNTKNNIQLVIKCNLFTGNKYGIIGSGPLIDQGSPSFSAGNRFQSSGASLNIESSLIGKNTNPIKYYYKGGIIDDFPIGNNNSVINDVDGSLLGFPAVNNNINTTVSTFSLNCTNILTFMPNLSLDSLQTKFNEISIYPNPSSDIFILKGLKSDIFLTIIGIDGKLVRQLLLSPANYQVNLSDLSNGIYIFVINDGISTSQYKVIKAAE